MRRTPPPTVERSPALPSPAAGHGLVPRHEGDHGGRPARHRAAGRAGGGGGHEGLWWRLVLRAAGGGGAAAVAAVAAVGSAPPVTVCGRWGAAERLLQPCPPAAPRCLPCTPGHTAARPLHARTRRRQGVTLAASPLSLPPPLAPMSGAPRPAEPPRGHSAPQEPPPAAGAGAGSGAGEASGEPPSEPDSPGGAQGDKPETRSVCSSESGSGSQPGGAGPICKICFQGPEQGELLNPCRCDGSVRYTHQLCLLKWISERGSWTCELCCYRYHVIAIKMKKPCQWQSITITLVEKVQMVAVILGSLFLVASVTWLLWSAFSPYAVWQRKDILFQICYGMYGFMDLVCIGLIVHEGASVYRVFKRWRAVNLHWDVLNYDKATDIEESNRGESSAGRTLWLPLTAFRNRNLVHPTQLTSPRFQCGYVLLHLFNRMRPQEDSSEDNGSGEVVMRVTSV
ncbi:E3 ubiquitin-protein ligase MARCHF11 [Anas acuta]